jgi:iron complex outermembrane receptor protein
MRKLLVRICLLICTGIPAGLQAQSRPAIAGQVLDAQKKPVAGVSMGLLAANDSALLATVLTAESGRFVFTGIRPGSYIISAKAVQYKPYYTKTFTTQQLDLTLPVIVLQDSSAQLAAVTVTVAKPFTEQKIDRTVVNVDALISNAGSNALEVLEKTPGVLVDENGAISFKGKKQRTDPDRRQTHLPVRHRSRCLSQVIAGVCTG